MKYHLPFTDIKKDHEERPCLECGKIVGVYHVETDDGWFCSVTCAEKYLEKKQGESGNE